MRPNVAHCISARPRVLFSCKRPAERLHHLFAVDAALGGVLTDGASVALGDSKSPSSSSTSMVLMQELTVVVSTDIVDLVRFCFLFVASTVWVVAIVAVAREVDIFPVACRVHHGTETLDGALRDAAGASSSLPTVESERYSSMGGGGASCTSAASRTL
jgi:hypothetical protein